MIVGCSESGEMALASDYEVRKRMKVMRTLLSQMSLAQDRVIAKWLPIKTWRQSIFEADFLDPSFMEIAS
jgi:coenzyme F420-reducing hydrogenase delta subunit